MPNYIIHAQDGTDAEAPARRAATREIHLANIAASLAHIKMAVAILNAEGQPTGSLLIADFADRPALEAWLATEPYVVQQVWHTVSISFCRIAPSFVESA